MKNEPLLAFDNSYARLPERFYSRQHPTPVSRPGLIRVNHQLAGELGVDPAWLESDAGVSVLAGNSVPQGAEPLATAYAGHQFGGWVPQLGDGRAILLGELLNRDGVRFDVQLKGSGTTPYSRMGDGRSPLGPVLREFIVSETMAALRVPTTRALAAVTSGDRVLREDALPGAVLTRVAQSHIRVGTFQFFAARQDVDALRVLANHVIKRHYPEASRATNPYRAMLDGVIAAQAELIARWQLIGFIHGVMNTDNMLLSGETIDYGPCAFMDDFNAETVFSSIDHMGRYAYGNQPGIAHWNLACLAQTLLPILADNEELAIATAQEAVDAFPGLFQASYRDGMIKKIGLASYRSDDDDLFTALLQLMTDQKIDFTLTLRRLADLAGPPDVPGSDVSELFELPAAFAPWLARWRERLADEPGTEAERQAGMYAVNPAFIPRNHLVEEAIRAAEDNDDFKPFHKLVDVLADPYQYNPEHARYATPPRPEQLVRQTFCGT